ncbi:hypothetical protein SPMU_18560 [Sphingomonas mucosissima]|uniref:Glycosyltransferase RgtA/B/C/D-like domain-containing protein n=2 Tax=Sphingomonas mucosissima TaxID=370959 RepID=A0A245ZM98_9SPHN|nr:hypothetical protein SPMU_18560 [Sphingomonas mucosissima]
MVLVVAIALAQQAFSSIDCDVSWLITTAERMLGGARLYRDVEEVNPPASVLLYVPPVAIGRLLGIRPEALTVAMVSALAVLSLRHASRILAPPPAHLPLVAAAAAFILLVLPADLFAQREHVALIAGLPMFAVIITRSRAVPVRTIDAAVAGCAAGIMIAIKPHLALALVLPALWSALRRRSLDAAKAPEWIAAGVVCASYLLVVQLGFPDYTARMLPLLRLVYLPGRDSWSNLLAGPMIVIPGVAAILTLWLARSRPSNEAVVMLLAAAGFAAAGLMQGKGYLNHGYPAVATALFAITLELSRAGAARRFGSLCAVLLALSATYSYARVPAPYALRNAVERVGPPRPRLIGISLDFALGHPLTRWVDGQWVGRRGSLWVTGNAWQQLERPTLSEADRRAYKAAERTDAAILAQDIARHRPDVILVDDVPGPRWIAAHPPLAQAMRGYQPATRVGQITLWTPR